MRNVAWRKSSFSGMAECVEAAAVDGSVLVRNSNHPEGAVLACSPDAWIAFAAWIGSADYRSDNA